jgi:hypothetical protein
MGIFNSVTKEVEDSDASSMPPKISETAGLLDPFQPQKRAKSAASTAAAQLAKSAIPVQNKEPVKRDDAIKSGATKLQIGQTATSEEKLEQPISTTQLVNTTDEAKLTKEFESKPPVKPQSNKSKSGTSIGKSVKLSDEERKSFEELLEETDRLFMGIPKHTSAGKSTSVDASNGKRHLPDESNSGTSNTKHTTPVISPEESANGAPSAKREPPEESASGPSNGKRAAPVESNSGASDTKRASPVESASTVPNAQRNKTVKTSGASNAKSTLHEESANGPFNANRSIPVTSPEESASGLPNGKRTLSPESASGPSNAKRSEAKPATDDEQSETSSIHPVADRVVEKLEWQNTIMRELTAMG